MGFFLGAMIFAIDASLPLCRLEIGMFVLGYGNEIQHLGVALVDRLF